MYALCRDDVSFLVLCVRAMIQLYLCVMRKCSISVVLCVYAVYVCTCVCVRASVCACVHAYCAQLESGSPGLVYTCL